MRALAVVLATFLAAPAVAQPDEAEHVDTGVPAAVMAVYEQGKAAYDAKQYGEALEHFDRCVDMDPSRARWHYNRGLALKKLGRDREAREAFADSRRMDPEYKRAEIDKKVSELKDAPSPAAPAAAGSRVSQFDGDITLPCCGGFLLLGIGLLVWVSRRSRSRSAASAQPPSPPAPRDPALREQQARLAVRQARLEQSVGEVDDAELRRATARAGDELQFVRSSLENDWPAPQALERATAAVDAAAARLDTLKGAAWTPGPAPRVGCFFCARPLATAEARRGVELSTGGTTRQVVSCERCAQKAGSGVGLTVRCGGAGDREHWSQLAGFDPYQHAYWGGPPTREVPAWNLDLGGERWSALEPLVGLATVGAGAALLGALDLDAARSAAAEAAAAAAAAANASRSRRDDSPGWRDHS